MKKAMRNELELKLKRTEKDFIDLKCKFNQLKVVVDKGVVNTQNIEDQLNDMDVKIDTLEGHVANANPQPGLIKKL